MLVVIWLTCGLVGAWIYGRRGRSRWAGFWLGLVLGPLVPLLAWAGRRAERDADLRRIRELLELEVGGRRR